MKTRTYLRGSCLALALFMTLSCGQQRDIFTSRILSALDQYRSGQSQYREKHGRFGTLAELKGAGLLRHYLADAAYGSGMDYIGYYFVELSEWSAEEQTNWYQLAAIPADLILRDVTFLTNETGETWEKLFDEAPTARIPDPGAAGWTPLK